MIPDPRKSAIATHQRWLGHLQPEGLVVSPIALVDSQVVMDEGSLALTQQRFLDSVDDFEGQPAITDFFRFAREFLGWRDDLLSHFAVSAEVPDGLRIATGDEGEVLEPTAAYRYFKPADPANPWLVLVKLLPPGTSLDELPDSKSHRGWVATPHQKFERLLRESGVPLGILCNGNALRLVTAPKGENSGWLTYPISFLCDTAGRLAAAALDLLLSHKRLVLVPENVRLPALLRKSRDYQAHVSTDLSGQVLEALYEIAHGFQAADEKAGGSLLGPAWERDPQELYGGLTSTLLRLVFLLYAEDRGLMPAGPLYQRNYSVAGLFEQLRADHERHPDTMDHRFGGWPRLLTLFRAVYGGSRHRQMSLPARQGHLFDPDRFPFLEGRASRADALPEQLPRVSDGTLHRILHLLLYLSGERLSYRTLDVEQIGSVYETIMGFEVQKATGRSVALKPKKSHGAPVHLDLDALLAAKPADREKTLLEQADTKLPDAAAKALKSAATHDGLLAALDKRIDRRATPHPVPAGSIILQPTDERRRSGSHYTARSFTNPIVRKTLEPILDRLGRHPLPAAILDLKICDIAIGSGAFQVEVCRQLADELVSSWHFHKCLPVIPPDEDELLFARRLVAQRCLYGVDRNPMAVDLAKLSLWLATMAKDHPFTFLDHAIKCGDSLVGLTNRQIAAFHWDPTQAKDRVFGQEKLEQQIAKVADARKSILDWTEDTEAAVLKKRDFLAAADSAAASLKTTGDLVIAAFFAGEKPKQRQQNRDEFLHRHLELQKDDAQQIPWEVNTLKRLRGGEFPIRPFHWEIEFPEVFSRENPGFDAIVGNPPFIADKDLASSYGEIYKDYIKQSINSKGHVDAVVFFFRRAFSSIRQDGTFGLLATKTIGQGDSRIYGLYHILSHNGKIFAATKRIPWPGVAAVQVSVVHVIKNKAFKGPFFLNNQTCPFITSFVLGKGTNEAPVSLAANLGMVFAGYYNYGDGFIFADGKDACTPLSEMAEIIRLNPSCKERIFPMVSGEEMLDSPLIETKRFIVDFDEMTEQEAKRWPELFSLLESKVKSSRQKNDVKKYPRMVNEWWKFWNSRPALRERIKDNKRILMHAYACKFSAVAFFDAKTRVVAPHYVIALETYGAFAMLQSRIHECWISSFGGFLEDRHIYNASNCFENLPLPPELNTNPNLETAGREYYEYRAALMVLNDEGLTKTYNRFHDPEERSPDIHQLRTLHAAMDRAVLAAYGWPDISPACEFLLDYEEDDDESDATGKARKKKKPYRYRWPDEVRDEVLARLLALNATRHAEEVAAGTAPGMKIGKKPRENRPKRDDELI